MNGLLYFVGLMIWTAAMLLITKDMNIISALIVIWGSLAVMYLFWKHQYEKQLERGVDADEADSNQQAV